MSQIRVFRGLHRDYYSLAFGGGGGGGGAFLDFFIPYTIYLYFKIKVVFIRCAAAIDSSISNMHAHEVVSQREFFNVSISFKDFG